MDPQILATLVGAGATPVVTALTQLSKPFLPYEGKGLGKKWPPLVALVIGITWNLLVTLAMGANLWVGGITGVLVGLAASGMYSWGQAARE